MPPELGRAVVERPHAIAERREEEVVGHRAVASHVTPYRKRRRTARDAAVAY